MKSKYWPSGGIIYDDFLYVKIYIYIYYTAQCVKAEA